MDFKRWQNAIGYNGYGNDVLYNSSNGNRGNDDVNYITFLLKLLPLSSFNFDIDVSMVWL